MGSNFETEMEKWTHGIHNASLFSEQDKVIVEEINQLKKYLLNSVLFLVLSIKQSRMYMCLFNN
jgi:hypothetical protein